MKTEITDTSLPQVLGTLLELMQASDSDSARIAAAKILLGHLAPAEDEDANRRQEQERQAAIAEAGAILAEFAAARSAGLCEPVAVADDGAARTDYTAKLAARMRRRYANKLRES